MTRTLFVLGALTILATLLLRAVADDAPAAPLEPQYVRFLDEVRADDRAVGAIRLMDAAGTDLVFTNRVDGIWRCLPAYGALVDLRRMERLFDRLLTAPAFVRSVAPADPSVYGLGLDETLVVSMHPVGGEGQRWEDDPPLLELEIGYPIPQEEQVFVRRVGERTVYVLEADPWPDMVPPARGVPPLVDAFLMPAAWPGTNVLPRRVMIAAEDGGRLLLSRGEDDRWSVTEAGMEPRPGLSMPIITYLSLLMRTEIAGLPDPAGAAAYGLDDPSVRIVIETDEFQPVEIRFGTIQAWGRPVYNSFVRGLVSLDPEIAEILLPSDPAPFVEEGHPNPWYRLLDRQPAQEPPWRWGAVRGR